MQHDAMHAKAAACKSAALQHTAAKAGTGMLDWLNMYAESDLEKKCVQRTWPPDLSCNLTLRVLDEPVPTQQLCSSVPAMNTHDAWHAGIECRLTAAAAEQPAMHTYPTLETLTRYVKLYASLLSMDNFCTLHRQSVCV